MKEIWRKVYGYVNRYEVSSLGRIRTIARMGFHPKNKHGRPHRFKIESKIKKTCVDRYGTHNCRCATRMAAIAPPLPHTH